MQNRSNARVESSDPLPGDPERHQATLQEYSNLLEQLRTAPATLSALTDNLIKPQPLSPLALEAKRQSSAELLRPDGQCSLARMAAFYGMPPWDNADAAQRQTALHELEDKRARHALQLEGGINVDLLPSLPGVASRQALIAMLDTPVKANAPLDELLSLLTESRIRSAVGAFLPNSETSLIGHLAKSLEPHTTTAQIRLKPSVYLEKILQSASATRLAQRLLEALDWYGRHPGEEASPLIRNKLLSRAIRQTGRRESDAARDIAGYPWHQQSNYGKSYPAIWSEFENHLLLSNRASSEVEAVLLASLYRYEFPSDFHRTDTPPDLSYRSSIVWVNFVHGLNLAQAFEPERVSRMTFQQLVDFPLEQSSTANEQELAIIAWCRIPPAVDWAIANGILLEDKDAIYTEEAQKRVIKALDNHAEALKTAVKQMDVDFPKRPEMADQAIRRVFGNQVFTTDGRKLAKYFGPDPLAGSFRQVPDVTQPRYSFRDVYMWKGHANQDWRITRKDGETLTSGLISFDSEGNLKSTASWIPQHLLARKLPDINELFETRYRTHFKATKNAYCTLLTSLFCSLPHDARQAIEYGETKIYTLRASTTGLELAQETHTLTMPLRLRMGFILRLSYNGQTRWYECLPRSGIIRERSDMTTDMLDGRITTEQWRLPRTTVSVTVRRGQRIPFDWNAHEKGRLPQNDATCEAIIEQFGEPFTPEPPTGYPPPISSSRTARVAQFIATSLFYYDEDSLYASARQQTTLERAEKERHTLLIKIVPFVPIFGNLDDLGSDNPNRRISAIFGLFSDALSFAAPVGKFFSGTAKLASTAIRSGFKAELPEFLSELRKLATASLQNFNPLDGVPTLTKSIGRGIYAANRVALNKATNSIARLAGRTGRYDFVKGLPQVADPGHYRLLSASDELISVRTIDDIPARNISNTALPDYRMLDPVANKPFGPALINRVFGLTVGRSSYRPLQATDQHVLVGVAENANIREIPEIDGRTTMFINDEPYRLDGDWLRRVEQIDQSAQFKRRPCRIKRAPTKSVCIDEFVTGDAHIDTPEPRSFEESKGFAPWFGERLCTPKEISGQDGRFFLRDGMLYRVLNDDVKLWTSNMTRLGFPSAWPQPKHNILADVLFQKGIYARIKIQGTYIGSDELHRVGAIAVPSTDGKTTHVFTIVNTDKCYLAQVPADKKLNEVQTLSMRRLFKAELEKGTLGEELRRIYEGSLTANNLAATYGIDAVEKAMRTMDEIAIPLGTSSNPPANMKWVKVDTTSGEALLFDNSTRMIVSQLQNGVTSWSRSKNATPALRKRCADIFDTLFVQRGTLPLAPDDDLRINQTMSKLQKMLPGRFQSHSPRNIAYADLVTSTGIREVYVSVSGGQGLTAELPLFRPPFRPDKVIVGNTTYFNIDFGQTFAKESLKVSSDGKILAIPRMERNKTRPTLPPRPTSLDSEAKLISVLREKYPDNNAITSIDVATTMPPCNSCAVVIKEFGYDGTTGTLNVLWS